MMKRCSRFPLERSFKIMRKWVYIFLQNYQIFTLNAAFIALPFAALALLSEASLPSLPLFSVIHSRLQSVLDAAGFPQSVDLFTLLKLKLSYTIATSFLVLPFTFTFLLLAKAFTIQVLYHPKNRSKPVFPSFLAIYRSLLLTQHCNVLVLFSANATCLCLLLLFSVTCADVLGLSSPKSLLLFSATGAVLYSIILANALVICNLALTVSGMEKRGGCLSILKACVLIRGRPATALTLALLVNILQALIEALFHYRMVRAYQSTAKPFLFAGLEGVFLAYLYFILLVLDTVIGCTFYRSCKGGAQMDQEGFSYMIEIDKGDGNAHINLKILEEHP